MDICSGSESSDSEYQENETVTESSPDGIKLKKKLMKVINRIKRNRKLSTDTSNESENLDDSYKSPEKVIDEVIEEPVEFSKVLPEKLTYDINSTHPGFALFIINSDFYHQPRRPFASTDYHFMSKLFRHLGFEIQLLRNKKGADLWREIKDVRQRLTKEYDCFVCIISSHGAEIPVSRMLDRERNLRQHVIYTRDGHVPTDKILEEFNDERCPGLTGKPKIFFIQACRCIMGADEEFDVDKGVNIEVAHIEGDEYPVYVTRRNLAHRSAIDDKAIFINNNNVSDALKVKSHVLPSDSLPDTRGQPEDVTSTDIHFRFDEPASFCMIPCYEDFLVMFSSASERTAWSDHGKGGWLLYCIYKVFKRLSESSEGVNLLNTLVKVCDKMARELKAGVPSDPLRNRTKATATIYHMLTKEIYLAQKHPTIMKETEL